MIGFTSLATALVVLPTGSASAQAADGTIYVCANRYNGDLRLSRVPGHCASTEIPLELVSKAGADETEQELLDRIQELEDQLNNRIDQEVTDLNNRIDTEVATLNLRIDDEVTTLNIRIDDEVTTINTRIDGEVTTLNTRIDNEVSDLNGRIDNEVLTLTDMINSLGTFFTGVFNQFGSCFNETFNFNLPLPDINIPSFEIDFGDVIGTWTVFPGFSLNIPDINLTIIDPVGVVNCIAGIDTSVD